MSPTQELPLSCPLRNELNRLRDLILSLEPDLKDKFGRAAKLSVHPVNQDSTEYRDVGLRWFVVLPWQSFKVEELG